MVVHNEELSTTARSLSLETVDCNFCGSSEYSLYDSIGEWRIVKCNQCGLCFTNPRPTPETIPSFYTLSYFKDEEKRPGLLKEDGSLKLGAEMDYRNRLVDIESHVQRRGSVLEIGAATGGFLKVMQSRGWKVRGIELSGDAVEIAKKNEQIDLFRGCLEDFRTEETYDVICMYQSLEHVPDPAYVIGRAHELLNADGVMVIEVPNLNGIDIKISKARKLRTYDLPLHLNHFTPEVLSAKLKATGFTIVDVDLYYPGFIIRAVEYREHNRGSSTNNGNGAAADTDRRAAKSNAPLPMAAKGSNWKAGVLKSISSFFPGWRFTIVARK